MAPPGSLVCFPHLKFESYLRNMTYIANILPFSEVSTFTVFFEVALQSKSRQSRIDVVAWRDVGWIAVNTNVPIPRDWFFLLNILEVQRCQLSNLVTPFSTNVH